MLIERLVVGKTVLLAFAGPIDVESVEEIREAVTSVLEDPPEVLQLGCARVSFLDSVGLTALHEARTRCGAAGVRFVLANPSAVVRSVLDVTGLADAFEIGA